MAASHQRSRYKFRVKHYDHTVAVVEPVASPEAIAARSDLAAFGAYVCGKIAAPIHQSWFPYLVTNQDSESLNRIAGDNVNLLSFRGSAKTTWARIWLAWAIGHNPHIQVGWISYKESIAVKSSRVIKRIIDSPRYREVFPHVRPGKRWGDIDWEIDKAFAGVSTLDSDITFVAIGITGAITSNRFHLTVYDDLIKSSRDIKNKEIREQMSYAISETIEPCVAAVPGSREVSLGTRFRRDDIHTTDFTHENGWKVVEQGAILVDSKGQEQTAWDRIPLERLLKIRVRNPVVFAFQWMNQIPPVSEDQAITEEHIIHEELPEDIQFSELYLGIDLAASEDEKGDFTALVLGARSKHLIWILEAVELRIKGNRGKIKEIMKLWKKWQHLAPRLKVLFEKGAYQNSFEGDWNDYKNRYKVRSVSCEGVRIPGDKEEKLESVSGNFQDKIVRMNRAKPMGRLVGQLLKIDTEHDDLQDGCVILISKLQRKNRKPLSSA